MPRLIPVTFVFRCRLPIPASLTSMLRFIQRNKQWLWNDFEAIYSLVDRYVHSYLPTKTEFMTSLVRPFLIGRRTLVTFRNVGPFSELLMYI